PEDRPLAMEVARRFAPGVEAVLEWPPPGLDRLRKRVRSPLAALSFLLALWFSAGFLSQMGMGQSFDTIIFSMLSGMGVILSLWILPVAVIALVWAALELARANRLKYGWGTLLDVAADFRGDTGQLIAGLREYSALSVPRRRRLQIGRRWAFASEVTVIITFIPGCLAFLSFGGKGFLGALVLAVAFLLPAGPVLAFIGFRAYEFLKTVGARRRLKAKRAPIENLVRLVEPWHRSLNLIGGQMAKAAGRTLPSPSGWVGAAGVITIFLSGLLVASPILFSGATAPLWPVLAIPKYSNYRGRFFLARALENVRLAPDPSFSQAEASVLFWEVVGSSDPQNEVLTGIQTSYQEWTPDPILAPVSQDGMPYPDVVDSLMVMASRGLQPGTIAWIWQNASHPVLDAASRLAYAPGLDLMDARIPNPIPEDFVLPHLPSYRPLRDVAQWKNYRAAAFLSEGSVVEAERELRETISLGLLLTEQADFAVNLLGTAIIGTARPHLVQLYEVTGRAQEASQILGWMAEAEDRGRESIEIPGIGNPADAGRLSSAALATFRFVALDENAMPGVRFSSLHALAVTTPCTGPGRIMTDPDSSWASIRDEASRNLVHRTGDREYLQLIDEAPARIVHDVPNEGLRGILFSVSQFSGAVFRNPRIPGCTALALAMVSSPTSGSSRVRQYLDDVNLLEW
ncbi:hypothetical protein ACFL0I_04770, partial [Gemmatimonadota bacterium]